MSQKLNTFQQVRELKGWHAVAFSATLVERMQPNYQLFCDAMDYEGAGQFKKSLETIWGWLRGSKTKINFALQLDKVEEVTPDPADFDNYGVFPAIDAAISLASTISLIMGDEEQGAVIVSKLSQGCVESFIDATSEEEIEPREIKHHPLMAWEIDFQQALIEMLQSMQSGPESVKVLQTFAKEEGVSNIGIEMTA